MGYTGLEKQYTITSKIFASMSKETSPIFVTSVPSKTFASTYLKRWRDKGGKKQQLQSFLSFTQTQQ